MFSAWLLRLVHLSCICQKGAYVTFLNCEKDFEQWENVFFMDMADFFGWISFYITIDLPTASILTSILKAGS